MAESANYPFRSWVPRWLGIVIHLFLFVPILFINGAYASNAGEMTGALGIISEHIQYTYYATSIGMVVFTPFVVRYLILRRPKMMYIFGFCTLFLLSSICAVTDSMPLLMLCSFLTGLVRIMLIFNTLFSLIQYASGMDPVANFIPELAPKDLAVIDKMDHFKAIAVPFLYLFFIVLGQLGSSFTAWLAYEYEWQYVYYVMMLIVLVSMVVVMCTMEYQKRVLKGPIHIRRAADFFSASVFLMAFCYVLVYGKTFDWFDDWSICFATAVGLVSFGLFVVLQANTQSPYLRLGIFQRRYTWVAVLMFMLLMLVNSHSMLVSVYTGIAMKIDNVQNANLGNYSIVGDIIGVVTCLVISLKKLHFRYYFMCGFFYIGCSALYLYFYFQPEGLYSDMIFPTVIRSAGMFMLYAMSAIYGMKRLPALLLPSWIFIMLAFRSVVGPVVGASVYANLVNQRQQQHLAVMLDHADVSNASYGATFQRTVAGGMHSGKSMEDATVLATMSAKGQVQKEAVLVTLKEIAGWTLYGCMGFILLAFFYPYPKEKESVVS